MPRKIDWLDKIKKKQVQIDQIDLQLLELQEKKEKYQRELEKMQQKYTAEMLVSHNLTIEDLANIISKSKEAQQSELNEVEETHFTPNE